MKTLTTTLCLLFASLLSNAAVYDMRLTISDSTYSDDLQIQFQSGATTGYDTTMEVSKAFSLNATGPQIFTVISNTYNVALNALPYTMMDSVVDVRMISGTSGMFTFTESEPSPFPARQCIMLEDIQNHVYYDLRSGNPITVFIPLVSYSDAPLYRIHFKTSPVVHADSLLCNGDGSGAIRIQGNGWNFSLTDSSNNVIANGLLGSGTDTIANLSSAIYTMHCTTNIGCACHNSFLVAQPLPIIPSFTSVDTVYLSTGGNFTATNTSQNAISYLWNFGDAGNSMNSNSNQFMVNGTHCYAGDTVGNYTVTIFALNGACSNTYTKVIHVSNSHIMSHYSKGGNDLADGAPVIATKGRQMVITHSTGLEFPMETKVYNMAGQELGTYAGTGAAEYTINLNEIPTNSLIIKATSNGVATSRKIVLAENE